MPDSNVPKDMNISEDNKDEDKTAKCELDEKSKAFEMFVDSVIKSKIQPRVEAALDHKFSGVEDICNRLEAGLRQMQSIHSTVHDCVVKSEDTFNKYLFPYMNKYSVDNSVTSKNSEVSVVEVPSGIIPRPKSLNAVSTKKVTSRFIQPQLNQSQLSSEGTEVVPVKKVLSSSNKLPPIGAVVIKPPLTVGMKVFCMASTFKGMWYPGSIMSISENDGDMYKVRIDKKRANIRVMSGKHLAYMLRPNVILPVGTRVIAEYKEEPTFQRQEPTSKKSISALYVGIISEPPKNMNNYMYLIFFDDGYAQYCHIEEVFLVCESSKNVWEDIHPDSSHFVKEYLVQYPERPMVKLQRGQSVKTEWNGSWWNAKVVTVHGSLVKMFFESDKRTEWIYRGSTRLGPLFDKLNQKNSDNNKVRVRRQGLASGMNAQRMPYVEYTYSRDEKPEEESKKEPEPQQTSSRNVARKSVSKPQEKAIISESSQVVIPGPNRGSVEKVFIDMSLLPTYKCHRQCTPACLSSSPDSITKYLGTNPLEIPTYCGWRREIVKDRPGRKRQVFYVAPCGRRLRNIGELSEYLFMTNSKLTIDLFCFDSFVQTFQNYLPGSILAHILDISYGKENVPVSCVNTVNRQKPDYLEYSTKRVPSKRCQLNLDKEFLTCCDCVDNCYDKSKCSCQQLTIQATKLVLGEPDSKAGYINRRLEGQLFTGLYECNDKCSCDSRCSNKVVQNGLQNRLQLFKTIDKGWGLRTLDDLPKGSFICIYAGQLLTEHEANIDGTKFGDEYMAELDYIEVIESQRKEGYESDLPVDEKIDSGPESDNYASYHEDSSDSESAKEKKSLTGMSSEDCQTPEKQSDNDTMNWYSFPNFQPRPLSPGTAEKLNSHKRVRKPKLASSSYQSSESDSDEDKSSKDATSQPTPHVRKLYKDSPNTPSSEEKTENLKTADSSLKSPVSQPIDEVTVDSVRLYFGEEYCYIMDAKCLGNIGRYMNHSCNPNVFVQNVFVDTHDLRFPWVTFFANKMIKAGDELTWDYNYEVGSVKGREIYCHCKSDNCRGRLL